MIKKYFVSRPKDGYQYDRKENKYFSWGFDIWLDGSRVHERGFFTKEHAEAAVTELRTDAKNKKHGIASRKDSPLLIELFQKKLNTMASGPERARAKRVFKCFLALIPDRIKVIDLKTVHLSDYQQKRIADGVKHSTIKREMVPIVEALNNADQYFSELESYKPPRKPKLAISKTRKTLTIGLKERQRLFTYLFEPQKEGERAYQAASRRRTGLFLQFCLLTVSRPGEVAALRRSDVDLQGGLVKIKGTKTENKSHSIRELPITETMRLILDERLGFATSDFLFTKGGKVTPKMYERLKEACSFAGIKYGKNILDGITFYTARHTATSELVRSGVDLRTAGKYTGHSDETMTMYYSHGDQRSLNSAAEILEQNMGKILYDGEFLESKPESSKTEIL